MGNNIHVLGTGRVVSSIHQELKIRPMRHAPFFWERRHPRVAKDRCGFLGVVPGDRTTVARPLSSSKLSLRQKLQWPLSLTLQIMAKGQLHCTNSVKQKLIKCFYVNSISLNIKRAMTVHKNSKNGSRDLFRTPVYFQTLFCQ